MRFFSLFLITITSLFSTEFVSLKDAQDYIYSHLSRKLHLGCGENKLENYINIDFPLDNHTIQTNSGADLFFDITKLKLENSSIDEIRNHHLFEHFSRFDALAFLCAWHLWLKKGGKLVIETPDFEKCVEHLVRSKNLTYSQRQLIIRHVFGSHEAFWAYHLDGWYLEKFRHILTQLGFGKFSFNQYEWANLANIIVKCEKEKELSISELIERCKLILADSLVNKSSSELKMLEV